MRCVSWLSIAMAIGAAIVLNPAAATMLTYNLVDMGSNKYRYEYTILNDSLGANLGLFDISFAPTLYQESSLKPVSDASIAAAWNESILASAPGIPAGYDAFSLGSGIAPGASLSGFAVEFTWLGAGRPGTQPFEIYDPITFASLDQGFTTPVPVPNVMWLMAAGVYLMARYRRQEHSSPIVLHP